jgi:hypothetical protein
MTDEEIQKLKAQIANEIYSTCVVSRHRINKELCRHIARRIINRILIKKKQKKVKGK